MGASFVTTDPTPLALQDLSLSASDLAMYFFQLSASEQSDFINAALTDEQLEVAYRTRRARRELSGPTHAEEVRRIREQSDPETNAAFVALQSPRARAQRLADHFLAPGIDSDLIGCEIVRTLTEVGVDAEQAESLAVELTEWRPHGRQHRTIVVADETATNGSPLARPNKARETPLVSAGRVA